MPVVVEVVMAVQAPALQAGQVAVVPAAPVVVVQPVVLVAQ